MANFNISFIGAGNVGEALCKSLFSAGQNIITVSSGRGDSASLLAGEVGATVVRDGTIPDECDIVILAVPDNAIADVAAGIPHEKKAVVVHTAGGADMNLLNRSARAGVLYPLQTFSRGITPDLQKVPFFIEATDRQSLEMIRELAGLIGSVIYECDSEHRKYLHLAAVFINNFSNFMMTSGEDIARKAGFDPEVMRPLMEETFRKILNIGPSAAQTGPAVRHDTETIKSHIELLSFSPEYQKLYQLISDMICGYGKK